MFLGTHTPKLDDKGRFFLPAKFREELNGGLVITRQPDRCLAIFTPAAYQAGAGDFGLEVYADEQRCRLVSGYNPELFEQPTIAAMMAADLPPGAAQASRISSPGWGASKSME